MKLSEQVRDLKNTWLASYARQKCDELADEVGQMETDNKWMRREIERVGQALFTGKDGYVGTEEDLQAIGQFVEGICETLERIPKLEASLEQMQTVVEAMERIVQWSKAYPLDVFPEPNFKKAHKLLKAGGMTLDAISASNMRHVVEGVGKIAKESLAALEE